MTALFLAVSPAAFADEPTTAPAPENPVPSSTLGAPLFDSGKLLATGGISQVEGAGGGGLASWALINGYGTEHAIGATAHYTYIYLPNYTVHSAGVGVGLYDRVEFTFARLAFDTRSTGRTLGLGNGFTFHEDVLGAKLKVIGDAVYAQDSWLPQIAIGTQYKTNNQAAVIRAIGGKHANGFDFYVAATKIFLAESLLVNATIRETKANQFGILGFGGDRNSDYTTQFEGSVVYLLSRDLAIGAEFRTKPDNLRFAHESNAADAFVSYFFNKHLSGTLAFLQMGDIATQKDQHGLYVSLQTGL